MDPLVVVPGDGLDLDVGVRRRDVAPKVEIIPAPALVVGGGVKVEAGFRNEPALVHPPSVFLQPGSLQMDRHLAGRVAVHVEVPGPVSQIEAVDQRFARTGVPGVGMVGAADFEIGANLAVRPFRELFFRLIVRVQQVSLQVLRQIQAHAAAHARGLVDVQRLHLPSIQRKPAREHLGGPFRPAVPEEHDRRWPVADGYGRDLEGDVAAEFRPVQDQVDPRHRPHERELDLGFPIAHETVQPSGHGHAPAVFVGVGHIEAVGFHGLARKRRQGVAEVCGDKNVVRDAGQEGGLDRNDPVLDGELSGTEVPPLFQQPFCIVYQ